MNLANVNEGSPIFLVHNKFCIQAGLNKYELLVSRSMASQKTELGGPIPTFHEACLIGYFYRFLLQSFELIPNLNTSSRNQATK